MTNTQTDWELGDTQGPIKITTTCEAKNAISAGDFVRLHESTDGASQAGYDGPTQVYKHAGTAEPFGVALFDAAAGETFQVLLMGIVKITYGGAFSHDGQCAVKTNQVFPASASSTSIACGFSICGVKAVNETGIIFFVSAACGGAKS